MVVVHGLFSLQNRRFSGCICLLHLMVMLSIFLVSPTCAELPKFHHPPKCDGSLSLLVIGDWGRKGTYNQSEVAVQMGRIGEKLDIDFVISTGDNFYDDGLEGILDPAFKESFTAIYNAKSLQKQWYSVLGNHDYRGDTEAQLSPALRKVDSRWLCLRNFIVNAETAEFFLVDTTPFVDSYYNDSDHTYNWGGVTPREPYLANLLMDLESTLKNSTAKWKFVIGHHAIRSVGHHGDTQELIQRLLPILKDNDVHFFVNGHDHCLEHISTTDSQIQFLTSGAGSKSWRGDVKENYPHEVKFFYDGQGFMSVVLNNTHTQLAFYDINGDVLHKWDYSLNHLHSSI